MAMLRPAPDDYGLVTGRTRRLRVTVDSWLAGDVIAESIPIDGGSLTETGDQFVPETLNLSVPRVDNLGRKWRPTDHLSPLAQYGQRLYVSHGIVRGDGSLLDLGLGWFAVQDWDCDRENVNVTAVGLGQVLADSGLVTSTSPPAGATFASEIPRLVDGLLPVSVDAALVDRAVPPNMAWQDDRVAALVELLTAWPARSYVDEQGVLVVTTPYSSTDPAELTLVELGGTVVSNTDSGTRQGLPSLIIAKGEDAGTTNRAPVVAYAADTDPSSPTFIDRYGIKSETFSSPLLTTQAQALKAASTRLANTRRQARTIPVTTIPDARLRPGVRVDFQRAERVGKRVEYGELVRCRIVASELPLVADGGAQRLELGVIV
jgi:hypothetical protein